MLVQFLDADFKFSDSRGSLIQLVHSGWNQVNYITSIGGAFRGGHYHKINNEAFFVISGKFVLTVMDIYTKKTESFTMESGQFFMITKNLSHSFEFLEDTHLISFYDIGVETSRGTKDIYPYCENN